MSYTQTQITYPLYLSASLEVAGGITGSILGTASYVDPATTTASYVSNLTQSVNLLGDLSVNGVINAITLNAITITSSTDYSSGSNTFGDALDDVHQFTGSVRVNGGITGSLLGTSSYAVNALTSSFAITSSYASTASISTAAEDILVYAKNSTVSTIPKGKVVRISGANGAIPAVELASNSNENLSANTLGITNESIAPNGFGYVMTEGRLIGVDFSAYAVPQLLYLGIDGEFTGSMPTAPSQSVRLGQVLRAQNNGAAYISINNGYELYELHDVSMSANPTTGSVLAWNGLVWYDTTTINATSSYVPTLQQVITSGNQTSSSINITGSLTQGANVLAVGFFNHAEGSGSRAFFTGSHAEGILTTASSSYSHAEGSGSVTIGAESHAEGRGTVAFGLGSHAEGQTTIASGSFSHAEGISSIARGTHAHAEGDRTTADGNFSHAEGALTYAFGTSAHAEGLSTTATSYAHSEGQLPLQLLVIIHTLKEMGLLL